MMTGNNTWGYSQPPDILWIWLGVAVSVGKCGFLFSALGALGDLALLVSPIGASALIIYPVDGKDRCGLRTMQGMSALRARKR